MCDTINYDGPAAVICQRKMAVGIKGLEGSNHAHDAIKVYVHLHYPWAQADL